MEALQYQYLMADEYFLEHNEFYSAFSLGDIQFLVNLNDYEAPIFQPSKIQNPYVSLIGNQFISNSSIIFINKVDPIFVAIRILRNKLENEQQGKSIEFENIFNNEDCFQIYLSKYKYIRENISCISNTKDVGDELYVKLDKGKLFQFLDIKYDNIHQYSQQSVYLVNDCNQKKQDKSQLQTCNLFKQYIGEQLFNEFLATKKVFVANQISSSKIEIDQDEKIEKEEKVNKQRKNTQQKKITESDSKTLETNVKSQKLENLGFKIKKEQQQQS